MHTFIVIKLSIHSTILNTRHFKLTGLVITLTLRNRLYFHSHLTDTENENQGK